MEDEVSGQADMEPSLVIEALQHMKIFYNIDDGLVDKIIESIQSMVCKKRCVKALMNELAALQKAFSESLQKSKRIVKENLLFEKKMNSLKGVNQKLVSRVTNMEKKFKQQEERKDEMRVKIKNLENESANLKLKIEKMKTLIEKKKGNFTSSSSPDNNSVVILLNKKNHSHENTKILTNKIKEQQQLLEKKLYVVEKMKKSKIETERKTKNRIKYLKDQILNNEQDIENLLKESQRWKTESNGSKQREENLKKMIEKLNRKIQTISMALEEKEKQQFLLNDFIEKERKKKEEEEEEQKKMQNNEDNYFQSKFRLSEGVKKRLEFFMNGKDVESNLEEKFWRFLMFEMEFENFESNRTSEILESDQANEEELLWNHYTCQTEHQKHHQRHRYYDPRAQLQSRNAPISDHPLSQQQQQHHKNRRFGTKNTVKNINPYGSPPSAGSFTLNLNERNSSMESKKSFSHYVKNMQKFFQIERNDKILILGENDFSLTKALLAFIENPRNIFSTCYRIDQEFVKRMDQNLPCNVIQNINPISVSNNMFTFQFEFIFFFFPDQSDANSIRVFFMHIYDFLCYNNGQIFLALHKNANLTEADIKQIMEDYHFLYLRKENFNIFWEEGLKHLGYQPKIKIASEMWSGYMPIDPKTAVVYSCTKI